MKKIKYIALIVILMLGLIGGAYAYWYEPVVVSGQVDTGHMDVVIDKVYTYNFGGQHVPYGEQVSTPTISTDGKSASFHVGGLYPQSYPSDYNVYQNAQIYIKNNSTLPVKLESVDLKRTDGDWSTFQQMRGLVHLRILDENDVQQGPTFTGPPAYFNDMTAFDVAWTAAEANADANYGILEPGWSARFGAEPQDGTSGSFIFWLEPGLGNHTQSQEVMFDITFNWTQYNTP